MMDLVILSFAFGLGTYFCSIELHRLLMGTWVAKLFGDDWGDEALRLFCFSLGCKLTLATILVPIVFFSVVL